MRNSVVTIPCAVLTFLIGLAVHSVFHSVPAVLTQQNESGISASTEQPLRVSVCYLQNAPAYFDRKRVSVDGTLYGDFHLYGDCSDTRSGPPVIAIAFQGLDSHINGLWGRLHGFPNGARMEQEVTVVGVLEYDPEDTTITRITIVSEDLIEHSPIRPFKPRGAF